VPELTRLLGIHELLHRPPPEDDRLPLTRVLRAELEELARARGAEDLDAWVGAENYEMRVTEDYVDRRVVELLRGGGTT